MSTLHTQSIGEGGGSQADYEDALRYLRIGSSPQGNPVLHVCAVAMANVDSSAQLFSRLNDINAQLHFARIFWACDQVIVESEVPGPALCFEGMESAYNTVGTAATYFGAQLNQEFRSRNNSKECKGSANASTGWSGYL